MNEWIKKVWGVCVCVCVYRSIYKMEYYLAMRKKEILPFVTTWMKLEGIMLSEVSQRKTNTEMISLICGI